MHARACAPCELRWKLSALARSSGVRSCSELPPPFWLGAPGSESRRWHALVMAGALPRLRRRSSLSSRTLSMNT
jgi:hypothetical protein